MNNPFLYAKVGVVGALVIGYVIANRSAFRSAPPKAVTGLIKVTNLQQRCLTLQPLDPVQPCKFQWSSDTLLYDNEKAITETALQPGQRVLVTYNGRRGAWVATKIEVDALCPPVTVAVVSDSQRVSGST